MLPFLTSWLPYFSLSSKPNPLVVDCKLAKCEGDEQDRLEGHKHFTDSSEQLSSLNAYLSLRFDSYWQHRHSSAFTSGRYGNTKTILRGSKYRTGRTFGLRPSIQALPPGRTNKIYRLDIGARAGYRDRNGATGLACDE